MHLYILTRGIKKEVDDLITQLQGKYLPFKYRKEGEKELKDLVLQIGVRPIQLWEIVYPEEYTEFMCKSLFKNANRKAKPQHKWQEKFTYMMRKALKLDPIPDFEPGEGMPLGGISDVEVVGIGVKKDYYVDLSGNHLKERGPDCYEGI